MATQELTIYRCEQCGVEFRGDKLRFCPHCGNSLKRPGRVRRFFFVILLTGLCSGLMFVGQMVGQMLQGNPDLLPWVIPVLAVILALAWERVTRSRPKQEGSKVN